MSDRRRVTVDTSYWPKPIPVRHFDWSATLDGYEPNDPIGFGPTEADAVSDLYQQIAELEDDQ